MINFTTEWPPARAAGRDTISFTSGEHKSPWWIETSSWQSSLLDCFRGRIVLQALSYKSDAFMPKIYVGTSGWAYSSWKPDFYPAKLASAKFLSHYAARLNSVEVNYTFRSFPADRLLQNWMAATPAEFKFAIKAHQKITHFKRLRGAGQLATEFISSLEPLEKAGKLGPVLFQLPPNLKCDVPLLTEFLTGLPDHVRVAFEFRDESWFANEVFAALRKRNAAICL